MDSFAFTRWVRECLPLPSVVGVGIDPLIADQVCLLLEDSLLASFAGNNPVLAAYWA